MRRTSRSPRLRGFTLVELLVVIFIILLISAVTLPTIVPALNHRRVSEAARILQAALVGARDAAVHYDEPRGIRLIPDSTLPPGVIASNRIISIEPAGDYTEGRASIHRGWPDPYFGPTTAYLLIWEEPFDLVTGAPNSPTNWYWNIRVGERFRFNDSGRYYTVIGPVVTPNSEGFVNVGLPGTAIHPPASPPAPSGAPPREFLWLVNGEDDNQNGYVDEQFDGLDNDLDGVIDNETETEDWVGLERNTGRMSTNIAYTIARRPVAVQGTREVTLPAGIYIDLTNRERSRLPASSGPGIDIMLDPTGQVVPTTKYASPAGSGDPFYHFWLAERQDLYAPVPQAGVAYTLPMLPSGGNPANGNKFPDPNDNFWANSPLRGENLLLTLYARTGNIIVNQVVPSEFIPATPTHAAYWTSGFLGTNVDQPYVGAQQGTSNTP